MALITGNSSFGRELAEALGLDPSRVGGIDIHVHPDAVVTATVVLQVIDKEAGEIARITRGYRLVKQE